MTPASACTDAHAPVILCAGIIVLDEVFRVERFPEPDTKAAVGPAGEDANGDHVLAALAREGVDCGGCPRIAGVPTALSAIFIDARGDRVIVTYRHEQLQGVAPADPAGLVASVDAVLADNRFPDFVRPLCQAARERGLPVVLDADRPTQMSDDLFRIATHVVFSSECLRATTGLDDLAAALARISDLTPSFLAVTQGAQDVLWRDGTTLRRSPVFAVQAVDTLGAGDVFHGGFALALAEGKGEIAAMRFAAAAAGLKCTRLRGSAGAPYRAEVETLLASPYPATASNP